MNESRQAYDAARAAVQKEHPYTTEGHVHAICACGQVGTPESIALHVEKLAEDAGVRARQVVLDRLITERKAADAQREKEIRAAIAAQEGIS